MEETLFLSPPRRPCDNSETETREPSRHHRQIRHHHHHATKGVVPKPLDPPITLHPGQVIFRILCHVNTAGGVIGSSGMVVKNLERDTGARIRFEDSIPNCHERVINVIGYATVDKKMTIDGDADEGVAEVSQAQEALIRVFERVLEVEGTGGGATGCRLLAGIGQIGVVIGKGGKVVDKIRKDTGTMIRVLPKEQLPTCATPDDELIQIMGGIVAVKKALVAISRRLQDRSPLERVSFDVSSHRVFPDSHVDFLPHRSPLLPPLPRSSIDQSIGNSLSADVDRILSLDDESARREVVFRLLCSASTAGGVIGKGATIVKALENETGASIKIAASVARSKERVATISALENPEPLYSRAQIAIIRVFTRSMEVGIERGLVSGLGMGETVTARLLVAANQVDCLVDEGGRVASNISNACSVEIQLLGGDLIPNCAAEDDKVLQIIGEYENVKSALFQVTGRLRDNIFSSMVSNGAGARHYSYSAIPNTSDYEGGMSTSPGLDLLSGLSPFDQELTLTQEMDHLGFVRKLGGPFSPRLLPSQNVVSGNITPLEGSPGGLTTLGGGLEHGSMEPAVETNIAVEVVVPDQVFGCVYGENGSNLDRLKQISGATVIVQDPCPGECDGKVIISGTPNQIQVAQSLLQAFILP